MTIDVAIPNPIGLHAGDNKLSYPVLLNRAEGNRMRALHAIFNLAPMCLATDAKLAGPAKTHQRAYRRAS